MTSASSPSSTAAALGSYCQAYGRWVEAEKKLQETAALIKTPSGYVQQNPWLQVANKQLELMHKYLAEFGLSPASRSRVTAMPSLQPKPWEFDYLDYEDGPSEQGGAGKYFV